MAVPFVPCPNTAQVSMRYELQNEKCENVYHFVGAAPWTSTELAALGVAMENWETTNMLGLRSNSCQFQTAYSIDLSVQEGEWDVSGTPVDGTRTSAPLPNNCSLAVKWITSKRGRSFRGRTYHIGLTEDTLAAPTNEVQGSYVTTLEARYRVLLTTTWPNSAQLVVRSIRHNNAYRAVGVMTLVKDVTVTDPVIDNQRRRLPFHNVHR